LAKKADIVIEGFRPGLVDRLQIGYHHFKKVNPSLIYLSISARWPLPRSGST
jgi:crotonobetainyl-CoA:carnitine CoA-transferase CaiB-like acyl-CoA transferase